MTHLVEVELVDGEPTVARFVCTEPEGSLCRAWCVECEEQCVARSVYVAAEPLDPIAQAPVEGHRFAPIASCRIVDWLGAGGSGDMEELHAEDEPLRPGLHPIEEEWDGDTYLWSYAEPEPEPAYPGHP